MVLWFATYIACLRMALLTACSSPQQNSLIPSISNFWKSLSLCSYTISAASTIFWGGSSLGLWPYHTFFVWTSTVFSEVWIEVSCILPTWKISSTLVMWRSTISTHLDQGFRSIWQSWWLNLGKEFSSYQEKPRHPEALFAKQIFSKQFTPLYPGAWDRESGHFPRYPHVIFPIILKQSSWLFITNLFSNYALFGSKIIHISFLAYLQFLNIFRFCILLLILPINLDKINQQYPCYTLNVVLCCNFFH